MTSPNSIIDLAVDHTRGCLALAAPLSYEYITECRDLLIERLELCGLTRGQYAELSSQIADMYNDLLKHRGIQ